VDLAAVLGVVPKACRPYRAKTKGKVERMVREVKESFLAWLSGQVLPRHPTLADYDAFARRWIIEVVLRRRHRTTHRVVGEAWADERATLGPIPARVLNGFSDDGQITAPAVVVASGHFRGVVFAMGRYPCGGSVSPVTRAVCACGYPCADVACASVLSG